MIDPDFDFFTDTPIGKDPDAHSPTLRRYHQNLWSKDLPNGEKFSLAMTKEKYLQWGKFALSSDAISNSYRNNKKMAAIIAEVQTDADELFRVSSTIGGYIIFPSYRIDRKNTINGARGMNSKIADRFDLTLECIRRHYDNEDSPLSEVLERYSDFFELFIDFKGYIDFFLLQDLVTPDYQVSFYLTFDDFERKGMPANANEYRILKDATVKFIHARTQRMLESTHTK
jgi:hypothetical protein